MFNNKKIKEQQQEIYDLQNEVEDNRHRIEAILEYLKAEMVEHESLARLYSHNHMFEVIKKK